MKHKEMLSFISSFAKTNLLAGYFYCWSGTSGFVDSTKSLSTLFLKVGLNKAALYFFHFGPLRIKSDDISCCECLLSGQFDKMKSPFEWDIVTRGLVAMTIEGFVGFLITILCQYNFLRKPP